MPEMPDHYVQRVPIGRVMTNRDLDEAFRPSGKFPALGPFKVYSPETNHWTWGWDLEYEGLDIHFQDGTPEGVSIGFNNFIVNAGERGRVIWIQGGDETDYALYVLTPASFAELIDLCRGHFRKHLGKAQGPDDVQRQIESTLVTFADAAAAAHYILEDERWRKAGAPTTDQFASGFGLIVAAEPTMPLMGLFHVSQCGQLLRRVEGMWVDVDPRAQLWADTGDGGIEVLWIPTLSSVVPWYDKRDGVDEMTLNTRGLAGLRFPRNVFHFLPQAPDWLFDLTARLPVGTMSDPLDRVRAKLVTAPADELVAIYDDDDLDGDEEHDDAFDEVDVDDDASD